MNNMDISNSLVNLIHFFSKDKHENLQKGIQSFSKRIKVLTSNEKNDYQLSDPKNGRIFSNNDAIFYQVINFLRENKTKLLDSNMDQKLLLILDEKLERQIQQIKADTGGIIGFFRYLFRGNLKAERQHQMEYLKIMRDFVKDVRKGNLPQAAAAPKPREILNEQPLVLEEEEELLLDEPIAYTPQSPVNETDIPSFPIHPLNIPNAPPAPIGFSTLSLFTMKKDVKFKGEPDIPSQSSASSFGIQNLKKQPKEQLIQQRDSIQKYLNEMDIALEPINQILENLQNLETNLLPSAKQQLAFLHKAIGDKTIAITKLEDLAKTDSAIVLQIRNGDSLIETPFFTDEQFESIRDLQKSGGLKGNDLLPEKLRKRTSLEVLKKDKEKHLKQLEKTKQEIVALEKDIKEIKSGETHGVKITECAKIMEEKKRIIETWQRRLHNHDTALNELENPTEIIDDAAIAPETPVETKTKVNPIDALRESIPEISFLNSSLGNINVKVLLKGDEFYNRLTG